eukprot:CAMPEP_0170522642 /NCGR_PEP_ID=MMETSP0209-20121228/8056_1 /TAXON_ID=665100 ORGANISM="Litonotus pictus, Strain P1" /NCGR_SAMPLE_ID=MMETSP0209 /ASSEMBLY_ACC=CAM_ASM_000301 /LENGTH=408 /DNA_ID=CAMNT_0010810261 /DNA_START=1489 /DNA_END=2716 /DNA_ORIENTATION=+
MIFDNLRRDWNYNLQCAAITYDIPGYQNIVFFNSDHLKKKIEIKPDHEKNNLNDFDSSSAADRNSGLFNNYKNKDSQGEFFLKTTALETSFCFQFSFTVPLSTQLKKFLLEFIKYHFIKYGFKNNGCINVYEKNSDKLINETNSESDDMENGNNGGEAKETSENNVSSNNKTEQDSKSLERNNEEDYKTEELSVDLSHSEDNFDNSRDFANPMNLSDSLNTKAYQTLKCYTNTYLYQLEKSTLLIKLFNQDTLPNNVPNTVPDNNSTSSNNTNDTNSNIKNSSTDDYINTNVTENNEAYYEQLNKETIAQIIDGLNQTLSNMQKIIKNNTTIIIVNETSQTDSSISDSSSSQNNDSSNTTGDNQTSTNSTSDNSDSLEESSQEDTASYQFFYFLNQVMPLQSLRKKEL